MTTTLNIEQVNNALIEIRADKRNSQIIEYVIKSCLYYERQQGTFIYTPSQPSGKSLSWFDKVFVNAATKALDVGE